jgi:hypothetical protein
MKDLPRDHSSQDAALDADISKHDQDPAPLLETPGWGFSANYLQYAFKIPAESMFQI